MARWIDGDELIKWIKETQHQTSKMRNVVCMVETMQLKESKWIVVREEGLTYNVKCPKCGARYHFGKHLQRNERTRWKCCPICLTAINGFAKESKHE